jgi:hypothetical protein
MRQRVNATDSYQFQGWSSVGNSYPEVKGRVDLRDMQGTVVGRGLPPTLPFELTKEDKQMFMNQLAGGQAAARGRRGTGAGPGGPVAGRTAAGPSGTTGTSETGATGTGATDTTTGVGGGAGASLTSAPVGGDAASLGGSTATAFGGVDTGLTPTVMTGNSPIQSTLATIVTITPTEPQQTPPPTPTPTPPSPSPSTFTFTQQYYGAWNLLSDYNTGYNSAKAISVGWGQRTGVYDGYFYSTSQGTRTAPAEASNFFQALSTGTANGTMTGTVSGYLGQTLTGTMTFTGANSYNTNFTVSGPVTLQPNGDLVFTYSGNYTDATTGADKGTGSGTRNQYAGTYFSQTASGNLVETANLAGNQGTVTNSGDIVGTRTMNGITTSFKAGFVNRTTALNSGAFTGAGVTPVTISSQGVLGPADASGVRVGAMTSTATSGGDSQVMGGAVRYVPASGASPSAMFAEMTATPNGFASATPKPTSQGIWAQTDNTASNYVVTQTIDARMDVTPTSSTSGTGSATFWGKQQGVPGGNTAPYGSFTTTINDTGGGVIGSQSEVVMKSMAAVVKYDGSSGNYVGPGQTVGIVTPNAVMNTTGTVSASATTGQTNYAFTGAWNSADSKGTLTSGSLTQYPGVAFQQSDLGSATVTRSTQQGAGPYWQTKTYAGTMTRTSSDAQLAVTPTSLVSPTLITSTTNVPGVLQPAGASAAKINIEGVASVSGGTRVANVTVTTSAPASGSPVSTFVGSGTLTTNTAVPPSTLNVNVVGTNAANPGANRVPATQSGPIKTQ